MDLLKKLLGLPTAEEQILQEHDAEINNIVSIAWLELYLGKIDPHIAAKIIELLHERPTGRLYTKHCLIELEDGVVTYIHITDPDYKPLPGPDFMK